MIEGLSDDVVCAVSIENAYKIFTGKRTFEELMIENELVVLPYNPDDSECKDTKYKVIQLMMDYFTQNEQYERCAELVKIVKNEKLDKNIQR